MTHSSEQTSFKFDGPKPPSPGEPPSVRLDTDENQIGWIVFDSPGIPVNKLTTQTMGKLRDLVDQALRQNVAGLVFVSDKPYMFIAGADVDEIGSVSDPQVGRELAAYGQAVFEAIARFPKTTIAVVNGPCVGGGYELALACNLILAEDHPSVKLGLPEVKLGILPGFGGTQRLPKRAGLRTALEVILAGKTLPSKPAYKRGMIDAIVPAGEGRRVAEEVLSGSRKIKPRPLNRADRVMAGFAPLRRFVMGRARKTLTARANPLHYPSPHMALDAVEAAYADQEVAAYGIEARLLGEAIVTTTSKNLVWLFQSQGLSKKPSAIDLSTARPVNRTAVLGAGVMGGGIAWLSAEKGLPIRIKDIQPEALEGAMQTAGSLWHKGVARRRMTPAQRDRKLENLSFTLDYSGFRHVDFVFEAVVENLDVKHQVISDTESHTAADTIIASNTSSLRIGDIAAKARHPERIVGLHFFNPVDRMPLVEVISGAHSDPAAVAATYKLALDLGKTPIFVKDSPGFLVNRLLAFYLGESLALLEAGGDQRTIDRTLEAFGMPMGPFALLDQIGLDVADKVTGVVGSAFGDRLPQTKVISALVKKGNLGKKSSRGFYAYNKGRAQAPALDVQEAAGDPPPLSVSEEGILDRLLLPMINEAARCLEEGVVSRPMDVDLGMVMGTGFPPFRGGLLRWADAVGVGAIVSRLEDLAKEHSRLEPSAALRQRTPGFYAARS